MNRQQPEDGSHRELPGHIRAAIDRNLERQPRDVQGRPTDSAGVAWAGRDLTGMGIGGSANPLHAFDTDEGTADPVWVRVLERLARGEADEAAVVQVLAGMRVFAPVVPELVENAAGVSGTMHRDQRADIALVTLGAPDGRTALPVFTSVTALTTWHPQARPVAAWAPRACLSAVEEGAELVVVDPGADVTFVVRRPAVWALGQQKQWIPSYTDETLVGALTGVVDVVPGLTRIGLAPGAGVASRTASGAVLPGGGHGPELRIVAVPAPGLDEPGRRLMTATLRQVLGEVHELAEKADTVEITLAR